MSLIHDAIREMEKDANPALPGLAPALSTGRSQGRSQVLPAVGGFAAVLALSAGGWWLWQAYRPLPAPAVAPVVATQAVQAQEVPVSVLPPVVAPDVILAPVVDAPMPPPASRPVARPKARPPVPVKAATVAPVIVEDMPVQKRFALFLQAMKSNDMVGAGEQLKGLQNTLPAGTLSRSRAEAWFALRSGQGTTARQAYRDILVQVPGDEEASVNLASIEARADRREVARQVLSDALLSNPDSEVLRHALSRFKATGAN